MTNKHRFILIAFWLLLSLLAIYQLLVNTRIQSDMSAFMSEQTVDEHVTEANIAVRANKLLAGSSGQIWLLALTGAEVEELAVTSKKLARQLSESGQFIRVLNGETVSSHESQQLLIRYRYLLDSRIDENYFSVASLRHALQQRLSDLASPLSSWVKKWLASDPVGASMSILESTGIENSGPELVNEVWFNSDHQQALLILETQAKGMDLDAQEDINRYIDNTFEQLRPGRDIRLEKSGSPVMALQSRAQIRTESQRLSMAAGLFMLLFIGWVYLSPLRVILSALPLMGGMLFATAAVSFLFGSVHGITLAFGITLLGVAVDYPVHAFSHSRANESFASTVHRIWPTLRLGVLTTILGYAAMAMTDLSGLAQLGVFSIAGLVTAALLTRSLLPALITDIYLRQPQLLGLVMRLNVKAGKGLYAVMALVTLLLISNLWQADTIWSEDIAELSPV
ncbi:MAG: MMPL family transporter, partial [Gammaproteobacteria bacterium]|nr:MMPL family transporter [Gammaproteobacteria bacterium]